MIVFVTFWYNLVGLEFLFNAPVLIGDHVVGVYALRSGLKQNLSLLDVFVHWKRYILCAFR